MLVAMEPLIREWWPSTGMPPSTVVALHIENPSARRDRGAFVYLNRQMMSARSTALSDEPSIIEDIPRTNTAQSPRVFGYPSSMDSDGVGDAVETEAAN